MIYFANIAEDSSRQTEHNVLKDGQIQNLPLAAFVEISDTESGVFLIRYDRDGKFCGDTWHESVSDAKKQALFEFQIKDNDWSIRTNDVQSKGKSEK